ncbi:MAG: efflux RND transporter permease subunit [Verrucomicrobia bacterium]|nr:efflux RND transporter permease subunit [Verrucomicrobiota bacterium]
MNLSEIFIRRPVMTILVMVTVAFFGVLAYRALPVSALPDVDYPTITVNISWPGADPQTIANNVVVPLEQQFTTIEGINTISSTSYLGSATVVLQFSLDRNIDLAAPDVQAAINAANPQLPKDLPYAPTYTKTNPTSTPILYLAVTSPSLSLGDLYSYGYSVLAQRINIVEGVSQVQTYGSPYAVRLRVDPQKMAARNIGIDDVGMAIKQANVYLPVGTLFGQEREYVIAVDGQLIPAEKYDPIIIKNDNGSITRFRDIGHAIDSVQNDKLYVHFFENTYSAPTIVLAVRKQPGANSLDVIQRINDLLPSLQAQIPASARMVRIYDESEFIWESVRDVQLTLTIALILVVVVIFFYLGTLRDTIIPIVSIPLSVLGAFVVMLWMKFTIDILSLLAITLAIGYLVDDAIVVLENIVRHVEEGVKPLTAALQGSKEISFTILSMTLCLGTVFIPLIFMGGIVGRILHEFAMTIVVTVLISGAISLSLTPLMCSRLIPERHTERKKNPIEKMSEGLNAAILKVYSPTLEWALKHRFLVLLSGLLSVALSVLLAVVLPKDFLPPDDLGLVEGYIQAADGTSPFEMQRYAEALGKTLREDPNVESVIAVGANPQDNQGVLFIRLKPIHERLALQPLLKHFKPLVNTIPGCEVFLKPLPLLNLQVGTTESQADYQYTLQSLGTEDLYHYTPILVNKMKALPTINSVISDLFIQEPQAQIEILRDRASQYNITAEQIENTMNLAYATSNLSPINTPSYQYYAIMETFPHFYRNPGNLSQIWLRSTTNEMVPLTAISRISEDLGPLTVNHINGLPSATIAFNLNANTPLSAALKDIQKVSSDTLPIDVTGQIQGSANVFQQSFANIKFLMIISMFIVYIILGILYENFFPPITVMSTLPPAAFGGLITLLVFGQTLSLYAIVGMIMLLGIVLKNGIILIDFANASREHEGKSIHDAIFHACMVRCRPILMTTFAALMGAVPIALAIGGATAKSRQSLGLVIVGGLLFSQVMTLYLTPVIYTYIEELHAKLTRKKEAGKE